MGAVGRLWSCGNNVLGSLRQSRGAQARPQATALGSGPGHFRLPMRYIVRGSPHSQGPQVTGCPRIGLAFLGPLILLLQVGEVPPAPCPLVASSPAGQPTWLPRQTH